MATEHPFHTQRVRCLPQPSRSRKYGRFIFASPLQHFDIARLDCPAISWKCRKNHQHSRQHHQSFIVHCSQLLSFLVGVPPKVMSLLLIQSKSVLTDISRLLYSHAYVLAQRSPSSFDVLMPDKVYYRILSNGKSCDIPLLAVYQRLECSGHAEYSLQWLCSRV